MKWRRGCTPKAQTRARACLECAVAVPLTVVRFGRGDASARRGLHIGGGECVGLSSASQPAQDDCTVGRDDAIERLFRCLSIGERRKAGRTRSGRSRSETQARPRHKTPVRSLMRRSNRLASSFNLSQPASEIFLPSPSSAILLPRCGIRCASRVTPLSCSLAPHALPSPLLPSHTLPRSTQSSSTPVLQSPQVSATRAR